MKIAELLKEQSPADQIAKDNEIIAKAMRQRWEAEQRAKQGAPQTPVQSTPQSAPEKVVTPDMIAKHPQYKEWYDKYLAMELPRSPHRGAAEIQAKKYADSKIGSLIRAGK
jgi:hypothetical protein